MNGKIISQAKTMIQRTPNLFKIGQDRLDRLREDVSHKEYMVFVKPVKHRLQQALGKNDDLGAEGLEAEADASFIPPITQEEADSLLVDEVFVRPAPEVDQPDEPVKEDQMTEPASTPEASDSKMEEGTETVEEEPVVVELPKADAPVVITPPSRPANAPRIRTMVEAIPDLGSEDGSINDLLMDDLHDIFTATSYINVRTKTLLKSREPIDIHELAKELQEYSQSIGASSNRD